MKFIARSVLGFVIVVAALAGAVASYVAVRIAAHEDILSAQHLAAKQAYLHQLAQMPKVQADEAPNIVVILFDDMGYGDIGAYDNAIIKTPNIDAVARAGLLLTQGFSAAPYCTPSRAGLLTGRLAGRMNLQQVTFPKSSPLHDVFRFLGTGTKLPADELTIAEILSARGYATHMVGKWHLGEGEGAQPNDFGFGSYFGVLFSNDMAPFDLYQDRTIIDAHPIDQTRLTGRYTENAVQFIEAQSAAAPFFLYLAHTFPHIPLYADPAYAGKSDAGLYGDVIEDLDRSVGAVMAALEQSGQAGNTLVIITSDNGPWYQGSAGPQRGRKNETLDGGMRVPFIIHWPGWIAPATSDALAMGTDILPTAMALTGTPAPKDRLLDGASLLPLFDGGMGTVHQHLMLEKAGSLQAIRTKTHKFRDNVPIYGGTIISDVLAAVQKRGAMLFDISRDPYEAYDVTGADPQLRARLEQQLRDEQTRWNANRRGWVQP